MLSTLLSTPGSNTSLTNVYIDGFYQEPADVAVLFDMCYVHHELISQKNGRISQHYKGSLMKTFETHPVSISLYVKSSLNTSQFCILFSQEAKFTIINFGRRFRHVSWLLHVSKSSYYLLTISSFPPSLSSGTLVKPNTSWKRIQVSIAYQHGMIKNMNIPVMILQCCTYWNDAWTRLVS